MKNIKICRGIKTRLGIFIFSIFSLISCQKGRSEPEKYQIRIENNYFEAVLVSIDDLFSEKLEKNQISHIYFLFKGTYKVTCTTNSYLKIENKIILQGFQSKINLKINQKGQIKIE